MRKNQIISNTRLLALSLASALTLSVNAQTKTNLSLTTDNLSASVDRDKYSVSLVNDRKTSPSTAYWSSWNGAENYGNYEYMEMEWNDQKVIVRLDVFWAADGDSIQVPTDAYVSYWDGKDWVKGSTLAEADASDKSVTDALDIHTTKIRIYMKSGKACGIKEIRCWGYYDPTAEYTWTKYSPTLDYNYKYEYPNGFPTPSKILPEKNNIKGYKADGWWCVEWGPKCSSYVTEEAKTNILKKMNTDFAFFRDTMGWPPDKRARNGYYSTICVYGSGLYSDSADSTATGGWQSATWYNGSSWPMVDISYYPLACFDSKFTYDGYQKTSVYDAVSQQNACVHEGIHAIFADLDGCKNSSWYHEAGNTWLQGEAELIKTGTTPTSMGWLSAGNMIAPFMPIECYSGWLLDGSFGGPSAEGVNAYNSSGQQLCTWRKLLGGVQYGELFPHFLSEILGRNSIAWIWRYCPNRVLQNMADSLGEKQMRHLIMEYRAKQTLVDVGQWSNACRKLITDNWLTSLKEEWSPYSQSVKEWKATPYANMYKCNDVDSAGWYYPEYRTTPGWSGANQIPLHVDGVVGNLIRIHFKPLGTNMVCMLCYRTKRGKCHYSRPIEGEGDVMMTLKEVPANNVVFAVVCNTDYIYEGDATRKKHFDYRLQMLDNVYQPASSQYQWFAYPTSISDVTFTKPSASAIEGVESEEGKAASFGIDVDRTRLKAGEDVYVHLAKVSQWQVPVTLCSSNGQVIKTECLLRDGNYHLPENLTNGLYILSACQGDEKSSVKLIINN